MMDTYIFMKAQALPVAAVVKDINLGTSRSQVSTFEQKRSGRSREVTTVSCKK